MLNKFGRWVFLIIPTFLFLNVCLVQAQNVIESQADITINDKIDPNFEQLYLVFAGPYPASPSSAFGHLFLLVEPRNKNSDNPQLWQAINFSANVNDHSRLSSLYNGLIGNLAGSFEVLPFYKKIRDYSYAESRDLWLFPVELNDKEKRRFSQYINNNREGFSQYRFADKNCATRVNEALYYTLAKSYHNQFFVLPQGILDDNVIEKKLSRPFWIQNIEGQLGDIVSRYKTDDYAGIDVDSLNATEKIQFLKTVEWLYNNKSPVSDPSKEKLIQDLRYEIVQEEMNYEFQQIKRKRFDIHPPGRVGINYYHSEKGLGNLLLDARLGLHTFGDEYQTYPKFDYIDLFRVRTRFTQEKMLMDEFWLFRQSSRQPKNEISSPLSWSLGLGGDRFVYNGRPLMAMGLYSGLGKTFPVINEKWTVSFMSFFNPTYLEGQSWSFIVNPKIENRLFFTRNFKGLLEISNPVFLQNADFFDPNLKFEGIYSLRNDIHLTSSVMFKSQQLSASFGIYLNLSI